MASGLAVVAFDYAAAQRVIEDGVSGALVPFGDNAAFVARAARIAADLAHCRVLGARARTSVMALDWDSIAQQVVREHGGQISYDYVRPHVVFTVELPADQNRG